MYRWHHLSVYHLYSNDEQGVFGLYCMCGWDISVYNMYCVSEYRVYIMCRRIHLQHYDECGVLYNMFSSMYSGYYI